MLDYVIEGKVFLADGSFNAEFLRKNIAFMEISNPAKKQQVLLVTQLDKSLMPTLTRTSGLSAEASSTSGASSSAK